MTHARVISPGMLTTVQDLGRWGHQSRGVPVAGPMDVYSHRLANALAGNPVEAAALEITLVGPELEFEAERRLAVTGAEFEITVDERPAPMNVAFSLARGSRLKFGQRGRGARAYLAVEGGIAVAPVLGSRSTHIRSGMGGVEGRALKAGDRLPLGPKTGPPGPKTGPPKGGLHVRAYVESGFSRTVRVGAHVESGFSRTVRILPGPQRDYFSDRTWQRLVSAPYTIGHQSDRMGFRLEGPTLTGARAADIISDVTPMGTLQVPASGLPILLMADRQTTGGYPKIATVISADLGLVGQLAPGDAIAFVACSLADATTALIARERALMGLERGQP